MFTGGSSTPRDAALIKFVHFTVPWDQFKYAQQGECKVDKSQVTKTVVLSWFLGGGGGGGGGGAVSTVENAVKKRWWTKNI